MLPKSLLFPILIVGAALAVALVMLFVVATPDGAMPAAPPATQPAVVAPRPLPDSGGFGATDQPLTSRPMVRPATVVADAAEGWDDAAVAEELADEEPMQPWEAAINQILESDEENQQVVMRLQVLAPTLPLDGQVEAVQHMVNLTDDESYQGAAAMLLNPATAEEVAEVIYSDVLNRPNTVKLPVMVSILQTPGHRLREETLNTLQIFLGEDLGDNPAAWNAAVQSYLIREAQEEAADEWEETEP